MAQRLKSSGVFLISARTNLLRAVGALLLAVSDFSFASPPEFTAQVQFGPRSGRPFTNTSAWNSPIPAHPLLQKNSAAIVSYLAGGGAGNHVADLYEFGVPVYNARASTSRYEVTCTAPFGDTCGLELQLVPIPQGAEPAPGSDAAMVVIDWSARLSYEFWQARKDSTGNWEASWGGVIPVDSDGYDPEANLPTGSGVPRLAGVIRAFEIGQGHIDHALIFSSSNVTSAYRYPAAKSDQSSTRSDALTMGARLQLDPSLDIDAIEGITEGEKIVAKALQKYGAYVIDGGGARMAFVFENPIGESDPYPGVGLSFDYFELAHIPWNQLWVLRSWDGR